MESDRDEDEEALRGALGRASAMLADGRDFEAHEELEPFWLAASGDTRRWLQGVIQFAASSHHLRRGRLAASTSLAQRAAERLADAPEGWLDFPLGEVARAARRRARGSSPGDAGTDIDRSPIAAGIPSPSVALRGRVGKGRAR